MRNKKTWGEEIIHDLNDDLFEAGGGDTFNVLVYNARLNEFKLIVAVDFLKRVSRNNLKKFLSKVLTNDPYSSKNLQISSLKEITPEQTRQMLKVADKADYLTYSSNWARERVGNQERFSLSYYDDDEFQIEETLFDSTKLTLKKALEESNRLMCGKTFDDELERIYSDENPKKFYDHPVHYKIEAKNSAGARKMAELLCRALYTNKRLIGRCISVSSDITEQCYGENDIN